MRTNPNGLNSDQARSCLNMSTIGAYNEPTEQQQRDVQPERAFAFFHQEAEKEPSFAMANGEHLMSQSLIIQAPFRRIRHPELTPIMPRERDDRFNNHGSEVENLMTQSLIMAPFRRIRHAELTPVIPRGRDNLLSKGIQSEPLKAPVNGPKRAFSMTRLDQLARPRQRYLEESLKLRASVTKENLISPTRPTSSMSSSMICTSSTSKGAVLSLSGTVPYRPLASARKPRPISIAGSMTDSGIFSSTHNHHHHLHHNLTSSPPHQVNSTTIERPSRSAIRAKLPFNQQTPITNTSTSRAQSVGSGGRPNTLTLDLGLSSQAKPTPPRKPAHVKAASAARKLAKQIPENEVTKPLKKSESMSKLVHRENSGSNLKFNISTAASRPSTEKVRSMRKSVTNPEKISATLNLLDESKSSSTVLVNQQKRNATNNSLEHDSAVTVKQSPVSDLGEIPERPNSETKSTTECDSEPSLDGLVETVAQANLRKEISQEEYRRAMAEKRRLAREQAEKEAEQERQQIEKEKAMEEERRRQEEEQHRLQMEEQQRLHEEYRRQEEERLQKHHLEMEELQKKETEERNRLEEESRAREEQERKNREKAEKARLELEERLRKDEEERIARKKRLDAIMSRTRKTPGGAGGKGSSPNSEGAHTPDQPNSQSTTTTVTSTTTITHIRTSQTIGVQQFADDVHRRLVIEQNQLNEHKQTQLHNDFGGNNIPAKPDVVEDAIKSNLINGKSSAVHKESDNGADQTLFVDNLLDFGDSNDSSGRPIQSESNGDLLGHFTNSKVNSTTSFAFSAQNSNEAFGAN